MPFRIPSSGFSSQAGFGSSFRLSPPAVGYTATLFSSPSATGSPTDNSTASGTTQTADEDVGAPVKDEWSDFIHEEVDGENRLKSRKRGQITVRCVPVNCRGQYSASVRGRNDPKTFSVSLVVSIPADKDKDDIHCLITLSSGYRHSFKVTTDPTAQKPTDCDYFDPERPWPYRTLEAANKDIEERWHRCIAHTLLGQLAEVQGAPTRFDGTRV
jgi:hypothetical protein